ncbi:hypothetical protein EUGRSUZ_A01552 [Eucalyptus grandis]|uniref:Uncharacterized protein n=2 Tax=Eucalyptus grandis TaxID=71139 RepID=A0A059DG77_EUCGR|nr:hypothetical protein EUGRSUZ_A01552 [Eucalyptus grandis]
MDAVRDDKHLPVARFARELVGVWCLLLSLTFTGNRLPSLLRRVWSCYMLTGLLAICTDITYRDCKSQWQHNMLVALFLMSKSIVCS